MSLFWGRKRWPRQRLRELIRTNHGSNFGLYRAKQTRFAGKYREMARLLRCKADLQQVVVSAEYSRQKFAKPKRRSDEVNDDEDSLSADIGAKVKAIILDESGFWTNLVNILKVAMPLIKLLRMLDGRKAVLGKVYDRMFMVGEKLKSMSVSWCADALKIHEKRWEYMHSEMHAAAYALDPEFIESAGDLDSATQDGLLAVLERMALRDAILASDDPESACVLLDQSSPVVLQRVAQCEQELALYQQQAGPFTRPSVRHNAKTMEPSAWWETYGKHLPLLCAYAKCILAQPAAASAAERNWSIYGLIKSDRRTRLRPVVADKLVYCHEALALHAKLQDAAYRPDPEPWDEDSDSDSDESGEEDMDEQILRLIV